MTLRKPKNLYLSHNKQFATKKCCQRKVSVPTAYLVRLLVSDCKAL